MTSRPESSPCQACAISFDDYRNQQTVSFKTSDPKKKPFEKGSTSIASDYFCHTGRRSSRTCLKFHSASVLKLGKNFA
jgi:hypothetical protein